LAQLGREAVTVCAAFLASKAQQVSAFRALLAQPVRLALLAPQAYEQQAPQARQVLLVLSALKVRLGLRELLALVVIEVLLVPSAVKEKQDRQAK